MQRTVNPGREVDLEKQQMNAVEHQIEIPDHNEQQRKNPPMAARTQSRTRRAQPTTTTTTTTTGLLPLFHSCRPPRPSAHRLRLAIHLIPLLVILCFGFLWWFSYPANVNSMVKYGRMTRVQPIKRPFFFKDTDAVVDVGRLTMLAVSTSPNPSVELALRMITDHKTVDTHPTSRYDI